MSSQLAVFPSLRGKTIFVTGGGSGIGAAVVTAFIQQGAKVAFVDNDTDQSEALIKSLAAAGLDVPWWQSCDVRDVVALQDAVRNAAKQIGDFAVLVNNVARDDRHLLEDVTPAFYDKNIAVNQRPAFFAIQSVVPGMHRLGGGSIINLGSISWQIKGTDFPCYTIAKSSVNGLTRGFAASLGPFRIRVNTVTPGWVMTQRQMDLWLDQEGEQSIKRNQCLPDKLQPTDIARMVLFLASDDAAMCTAQEFKVDAGWS